MICDDCVVRYHCDLRRSVIGLGDRFVSCDDYVSIYRYVDG